MTFEQTDITPKNDGRRFPFAIPPSEESPNKFLFPTLQPSQQRVQPRPEEARPEPSPVPEPAAHTPEKPPFDAIKLMEDWESAYDKAHTGWGGSLTHQEIDKALAGEKLSDKERAALKTIKDNFDDVSKLDGDAMGMLTKSDVTIFKILLANTARDIEFHDKGQKFLAENKFKLDKDRNGKVDWFELNSAITSLDFKKDQLDTISYLTERYSNTLHFTDVDRTKHAFNTFQRASVPDQDFAPGGLSKVIDKTQSLAYTYKFADDYRGVTNAAAFGIATMVTRAVKMGFWAKAGTLVGSIAAGGIALKTAAEWQGPVNQDEQDVRIKRLMTKVANFNY